MWVFVTLVAVLSSVLWVCWRKREASLNARGKHVLITGCDSGFGRETAIRLDEMGVFVLATCLTKEGEESLKSVASDRLKTFQMDVTNSKQIQDVFGKVNELLGDKTGLWGLVNNAGVFGIGPIEWTPLDVFKKTADVNLWGLIDVTKTFLPLVRKARGRVVLVSSIAGVVSPKTFSPYCISKYGVEAFGDALRREMRPFDVQVSVIEAGTTRTAIVDQDVLTASLRNQWMNLSSDMQQDYGEEYFKKITEGFQDWSKSASTHLSKVVDAIIHPLTSQSPKARYVIGWDAWKLKLGSSLPDTVEDMLLIDFPFKFVRSSSSDVTECSTVNGSAHVD